MAQYGPAYRTRHSHTFIRLSEGVDVLDWPEVPMGGGRPAHQRGRSLPPSGQGGAAAGADLLTDKHKVLMILVNLFSNPKYAREPMPPEERRLTVKLEHSGWPTPRSRSPEASPAPPL